MRALDPLPFPLLLFVRTHASSHGTLSALGLLAIATSVAMATGLEMASRSVEGELARTASELAGAAQLSVTAGDVGVAEELLAEVMDTPGVAVAAPVIEASFRLTGGLLADRAIRVIGVDLLADPAVRTYDYVSGGMRSAQPLLLLGDPRAVVVSDTLARELDLREGVALPVRLGRERRELVVRGVMAAGGLADAFGGRIAVMDVYSLQVVLGRAGWLDRIDVVVEPDRQVGDVRAALAERLAGRASVRRSAARDDWVENTLTTVRLVVSAIVVIAILVASLLAYGAMSVFVERRLGELSLLRTVGFDARRARRLLYVDSLLLALAGSALGLALGVAVSRLLLGTLSRITDFLEDVQLARLEISTSTVGVALGVGVVVALAGVVAPARRVTGMAPLEGLVAVRSPSRPRADRRARRVLWLAALAWLAVLAAPVALPAMLRVGLLFGLGLVAIAAGARDPVPRLVGRLRPALEAILPGLGRVAGASLAVRPARTGVHVGAVAGVLAGVTATGILNQSLASTLDYWMGSQYPGGVFVTAGEGFSLRPEEPIRPDVVSAIRETPGVRAVFDHYTTEILYEGVEVLLGASDMRVIASHGVLPAIDSNPRALALAVADGAIAVSDGFAQRFGIGTGDLVTLDTPKGARSFPVAGVIRDYAGPSGSLNLDLRVFDALWDRPGSRDLVLWTDEPKQDVLRRIEERVQDQDLAFAYGDDLMRYASRLLSRFSRVLDVVAAMTAALGGLAILNLLLGAVGDRRRELALLRSAGATRAQVSLLILVDGLLAGLIGGVAGVALGVACAWPLVTSVIPDALGWWLEFDVEPSRLAFVLGAVAVASLLAGLYPAWLARGVAAREVFAPE
jgi:putative ABC transport system permease protein